MRNVAAIFHAFSARVVRSVRDLPLYAKGLMVVSIPLAFLLLFSVAFYLVQRENEAAEDQVRETLRVVSLIQSVHTTLEEAETGVRGYLLTRHVDWLQPYQTARRRLPGILDQLEASVADDPVRLARIRQIKQLAYTRLSALGQLPSKLSRSYTPPEGPHPALIASKAEMDAMHSQLDAARQAQEQLLEARREHSRRVWRNSYLLILACILFAPAGGVCAMLLFTAGVARRIQKLDRDAHEIAEGRPIAPVSTGHDEIGLLEESLARAATLLATRETELRRARDQLEVRVRDRTAELARTNGALEAEIAVRNRAEAELRKTNETLSAVIQASPLAIVGVDAEGLVSSWNRAAERMFGWSEREVLGHTLPTVAEEDRQAFQASLQSLQEAGQEERRRRKDGSIIETRVWTAPIRYDDTAGGRIAILADFTERRQLEEQLFQAQKMEAIGRLAGGVAHDFNNLITIISGYGQMLLDAVRRNDSQREAAEEILKAAERATGLAGQLLAFSRRQMIKPQLVDCNALIRNVEKMLRRVIGEDIELKTALAPDMGFVRADPGQLEQVVMNLAVNARDAMPGGGKLWIETSRIDLDEEYCRLHAGTRPGPHLMLAVTDTGMGMNENTRQHLFEPFFTTKETGKGTGLGLSTVYGIVKQHGGDIWVYSEPGMGSTFKLYLPLSTETVQASQQAVAAPAVRRGTETVLIVEDDAVVRKLVRDILDAQGYKLLEADDGVQALDIFHSSKGRIDLLLTDVVMPRMNGRELADNLLAVNPELKVLYLSGYTDTVVLEHGVREGSAAFLSKPFTPGALMRKVRSVLDGEKNANP